MKFTHVRNLLIAVVCLLAGVPAQAQFTGTYEQFVATGWDTAPVEFKLSEVATALGTDAATLGAAFESWMAEGSTDANMFFLTTPDGPSEDYTQGSKGGFWVNASGVPQAWSEDNSALRWYNVIDWNVEEDIFGIYIGQYPEQCVAGDVYTPEFILKYNDKEVKFNVTMTIKNYDFDVPTPATLIEKELNVVGEQVINVEQFPRGAYDADPVYTNGSDIINKLGMGSALELEILLPKILYATEYNNGDVEQGGGMKKDSLTNVSTAGAPGYWVRPVQNADGEEYGECSATGWGADDKFFVEAFAYNSENDTLSCNLGQYPGSCKANENWYTNLYIVYGDKAYRLQYALKVNEQDQGEGLASFNKVGEETVVVEQEPTTGYEAAIVRPDVEAIAAALGCDVANIGMVALDDKDNFANSTANQGGWWFSAAGTAVAWGAGSVMFVEPEVANDFSVLHVGQYPSAFAIGDESNAYLYFINGNNYYAYTVNLKITEPQVVEQDFVNEGTRTFNVEALLDNNYTQLAVGNVSLEDLEALIGTPDATLYGLAIDSVATQTGNVYSKKYSCDPNPGFWLNADGRVSVWSDANTTVGVCYSISDGAFTFFQYPNRCSVGTTFKTQLFLVNEENNKMLTVNININFVESLVEKEVVGSENIVIPVSTDEKTVVLNGKAAADALGVTVADLLNSNNYYLHAMTSSGVYGDGQNAEMGLSFDLDGGYNAYGNMYFTLAAGEGDEIVLTMCSNDPVEDDYAVDGQFCFEIDNKQYIYYTRFVSEAIYNGISELAVKNENSGKIYDLSGRRVVNPTHGIYIQNGRKFVK